MTTRNDRERTVLAGIAVVAVATFLYSLLVTQSILAWFGVVLPLVFLYLAWRFVLAHERIAAALESEQSSGSERRPGVE